MKKKLLSLVALLLIAGVASAANIPRVEDAKDGPGVWTIPVYNNSGGTMDVGDVAIWDIYNSTGDNDNYVTRTNVRDTHLVAGVVYPVDIADGDVGTIAIRGVVQVDVSDGGLEVVNGLACTGTTAGAATSCAATSGGYSFGIVTQAASSGSALIYVTK